MKILVLILFLYSQALAVEIVLYSQAITLPATAGTTYFSPVSGGVVPSATLLTGQFVTPHAMKAYGFDCAIQAAPGTSKDRSFTLVTGATPTDTALTQAMGATGTDVHQTHAGIDIPKGTLVAWKLITTGLATTTTATCALFVSIERQ